MKILLTGAAGFIGYFTSRKLLEKGYAVYGIDNLNDYYSPELKLDRLEQLGVNRDDAIIENSPCPSSTFSNFCFNCIDLVDTKSIEELFIEEKFDIVCNLAAEVGVRNSVKNPRSYVESNLLGFFNILEGCRNNKVKHLVYASSSSVYGENQEIPFQVQDKVDHPLSLYAATKKSNELMAYSYSNLFGFMTTGLRFFTVYGPWGRPDMATFLFTDAIYHRKPIKIYNNGEMERDFTYVDDIVDGIFRIITTNAENRDIYKVYNIGNNRSVNLMEFIEIIEKAMGKKSTKIMLPMQPGDVTRTWADVSTLIDDYNYQPNTNIEDGINSFVEWYLEYKT